MNSFLFVLEYGNIRRFLVSFKCLAFSHDEAIFPTCGRTSDCRL